MRVVRLLLRPTATAFEGTVRARLALYRPFPNGRLFSAAQDLQAKDDKAASGPPFSKSAQKRQPELGLDPVQVQKLEGAKAKLYQQIRRPGTPLNRTLVEQMLKQIHRDFPPCMHVFNIILHARIMLNDREEITRTLRTIKEAGLELNAISYNLLMGYYRNMGHPEEAERLLERMIAAGMRPSRVTYTTLVTAFAPWDMVKARRYFDIMRNSSHPKTQPDIFAYNAMLRGHLLRGELAEADRLFASMRVGGIQPNGITYKILIEGLLKGKRVTPAWELYKAAQASPEESLFNQADLAELSQRFWLDGEPEQALEIMTKIDLNQLSRPLWGCLSSALQHAMEAQDRDRSLQLLEQYVAPRPDWFSSAASLLLEAAKFDATVAARTQELLGPYLDGVGGDGKPAGKQ